MIDSHTTSFAHARRHSGLGVGGGDDGGRLVVLHHVLPHVDEGQRKGRTDPDAPPPRGGGITTGSRAGWPVSLRLCDAGSAGCAVSQTSRIDHALRAHLVRHVVLAIGRLHAERAQLVRQSRPREHGDGLVARAVLHQRREPRSGFAFGSAFTASSRSQLLNAATPRKTLPAAAAPARTIPPPLAEAEHDGSRAVHRVAALGLVDELARQLDRAHQRLPVARRESPDGSGNQPKPATGSLAIASKGGLPRGPAPRSSSRVRRTGRARARTGQGVRAVEGEDRRCGPLPRERTGACVRCIVLPARQLRHALAMPRRGCRTRPRCSARA